MGGSGSTHAAATTDDGPLVAVAGSLEPRQQALQPSDDYVVQQRGLGVEPVHIHFRPQRPRCPSEVQFRRALRKFRLALASVGGSGSTHAAATIDDGPLVAVAAAPQMSF